MTERCTTCNSPNTEAIGYSIVDITHVCLDCDTEFDTERDYKNGDIYARKLKKAMHDRVADVRNTHNRT